jgi:hypothetical protein
VRCANIRVVTQIVDFIILFHSTRRSVAAAASTAAFVARATGAVATVRPDVTDVMDFACSLQRCHIISIKRCARCDLGGEISYGLIEHWHFRPPPAMVGVAAPKRKGRGKL